MKGKRYYWIKLNTSFFEQETIDFLMSQKNGCAYIVLYQMLCLKTANSGGELSNTIGERIVPYDINKIVRDTKYFDYDTVTVALELFKQLGLIYYRADNNTLQIANFDKMVGSETESAQRMRRFRARNGGNLPSHCDENVTNSPSHCDEEYRDKSIDNRVVDIDNTSTTDCIEQTLNSLKINKEIDLSQYSEEEKTQLYPFNPEYGLTTAEMDVLEQIVIETALERYLLKIRDYETEYPFKTILRWAEQDINIKS